MRRRQLLSLSRLLVGLLMCSGLLGAHTGATTTSSTFKRGLRRLESVSNDSRSLYAAGLGRTARGLQQTYIGQDPTSSSPSAALLPGSSCMTDADCPTAYICAFGSTCVRRPAGGMYLPGNVSTPAYYFPLTNGSVRSWPMGVYQGAVDGDVSWIADPAFNTTVLFCGPGGSNISISPPRYGTGGSFAINLWMKSEGVISSPSSPPSPLTSQWQYLYSHTATANLPALDPSYIGGGAADVEPYSVFTPNSVNIYLASPYNPLYGLVRVAIKDGSDSSAATFVDSDGQVSSTDSMRLLNASRDYDSSSITNVTDGAWHMITLTTMPVSGVHGYLLYVDGEYTGSLPSPSGGTPTGGSSSSSSSSATASPSPAVRLDGGSPITLDAPIHICGRVDGEPSRGFQGLMSQLMIFDGALVSADVETIYRQLYDTLLANKTAIDPLAVSPSPTYGDGSSIIVGYSPSPSPGGSFSLVTTAAAAGSYCSLTPVSDPLPVYCDVGMVCLPDPFSDNNTRSATPGNPQPDASGMCALPPAGTFLPTNYPTAWPTPMAYFPLSQAVLDSYPNRDAYTGNSSAESWSTDSRFGSVVGCSKSSMSYVTLDPVPYASGGGGAFAVGIWFKIPPGGLAGGSGFQYIYSHGSQGSSGSVMQADQVAIYAAEAGHARYGILRAVVRDHSDTSTDLESDIWIDSDGRVGDNSGFVNPNTPGSGGWMDTGPQNPKGLDDNEWHHVVVTTLVEGGKGYRLYLDGLLKAELKMGVMRTTDPNSEDSSSSSSAEQTGVGGAGTVSNASNYAKLTGGGYAQLDGPITLCGRQDLAPSRFLNGSVSNLMLWSSPLSDDQVAALYVEYMKQAVVYPEGRSGVGHMTTTGHSCLLPTAFAGEIFYSCLVLDGTLSCPTATASGSWEECAWTPTHAATATGATVGGYPSGSSTGTGSQTSTSSSSPYPSGGSSNGTGRRLKQYSGGYDATGNSSSTTATAAPGYYTSRVGGRPPEVQFPDYPSSPPYIMAPSYSNYSSYYLGVAEGGTLSGGGTGVLNRFSISGQKCVSPFYLMGKQYSNCTTYQEQSVCADHQGNLMECAPLIEVPLNTTGCNDMAIIAAWAVANLASSAGGISGGNATSDTSITPISGSQISMHTPAAAFDLCVVQQGVNFCKVSGGSVADYPEIWVKCPVVGFRSTTSGGDCQLPFYFNGLARSDCVSSSDGNTFCSTDRYNSSAGARQTCASLKPHSTVSKYLMGLVQPPGKSVDRYGLVDGRMCQPPAGYSSATASGGPRCLLNSSSGKFECTTYSASAPQSCAPIRRTTLDGNSCHFPFSYGGNSHDDCVWIMGVEACPISGGKGVTGSSGSIGMTDTAAWQQCAPAYSTDYSQPAVAGGTRYTSNGATCVIPYVRNGVTHWDCMPATGSSSSTMTTGSSSSSSVCPSTSGALEYCMPRSSVIRYTTTGATCNLPYGYDGDLYYDCMGAGNGTAGWCKDSTGDWAACIAANRTTVSGKRCVFPSTVNGAENVTDCVSTSDSGGTRTCVNTDGLVEECAGLGTGSVTVRGGSNSTTANTAMGTPGITGASAERGAVGAAYPQLPPQDASSSTTTSSGGISDENKKLAIGLGIGLGGGLLLTAAIVGMFLTRKGYIYQWRSHRFHEMTFDPYAGPPDDMPGSVNPKGMPVGGGFGWPGRMDSSSSINPYPSNDKPRGPGGSGSVGGYSSRSGVSDISVPPASAGSEIELGGQGATGLSRGGRFAGMIPLRKTAPRTATNQSDGLGRLSPMPSDYSDPSEATFATAASSMRSSVDNSFTSLATAVPPQMTGGSSMSAASAGTMATAMSSLPGTGPVTPRSSVSWNLGQQVPPSITPQMTGGSGTDTTPILNSNPQAPIALSDRNPFKEAVASKLSRVSAGSTGGSSSLSMVSSRSNAPMIPARAPPAPPPATAATAATDVASPRHSSSNGGGMQ